MRQPFIPAPNSIPPPEPDRPVVWWSEDQKKKEIALDLAGKLKTGWNIAMVAGAVIIVALIMRKRK